MSAPSIRLLLLYLILIVFSTNSTAKENTLPKKEITTLINDASTDLRNEEYDKSLLKLRIALEKANKINDLNLISNTYLIIGANFDELADFNKALHYYNIGLYYANRIKNNFLKNQFYNNIGNIYCFDKKDYKKGIYYYEKSLLQSKKIEDFEQLYVTNLNLAWVYFENKKFEKGLTYLNYINKRQSIDGNSSTVVILNMLNGMFNSYINNHEKATSYFQKAIALGEKGNEKDDLSYSYLEYSKFLIKINQPNKAYNALLSYHKITDKNNIEEKLLKANVIGTNLEIDQYKREIDKIETEFKSKETLLLEEQSQNKKIVLLILLIVLIASVFTYFFIQNSRLKHYNRLKDIQSKAQENLINASIDGQELERKKIASFLHDNVSSLLSSAGMHLNVFAASFNNQTEEIQKTKKILEETHKQIRNLSHELMPTLLVRFGLLYAIEDLCEKTSNSKLKVEYNSTLDLKKRYNEEFEMKIYFITTELINNIIKHSNANKAFIDIVETNTDLIITVKDNGTGFNTNEATELEGFGINQIRARINNLKGEFKIQSTQNKGTIITIKVPYTTKTSSPIIYQFQ